MSQGSGEKQAAGVDSEPVGERHEAPSEGPPSAEGLRKLDFSRPTKFTTDLRRPIERALDQFCEALSARLSTELGADFELRVGPCEQLTWAAAKAQLPADSIAVAVEVDSIGTPMLLNVDLPLMLQALETLLGGSATNAPTERRLSEIDWMLARRLSDVVVHQLSLAWHELAGVECRLGELDMEADAGVIAPAGEPTLAVKLESAIDGLPSSMSLLIPWTATDPLAPSIRGIGGRPQPADPHEAEAVRRGLAGAQITLRAEVGSVEMPIERMLALAPGMLLELRERVADGVRLCAEGVALGRARPGCAGARRAVKLQSTIEPSPRADTYAKLARNELDRARANMRGASPDGRGILHTIFVRVWVELGSAHVPFGRVLELTPGAVVELDQAANAPVDLLVNGLRFAHGELVVTGEGEWGVRMDGLV
jgi:flagellar motor switch protein FliM